VNETPDTHGAVPQDHAGAGLAGEPAAEWTLETALAAREAAEAEVARLGALVAARDQSIRERDARLAEITTNMQTLSTAYKELLGEIEATKGRLERQAKAEQETRRGEVVRAMFKPVEDLRLAVDGSEKVLPADVLQGFRMNLASFMDALKALGLEEVPGEGAAFSADVHEAVFEQPVDDPALDGRVLKVWSAGFRIGPHLIRAGKVVVGRFAGIVDG
jgi:molecular chaperone GrpE (heat shock protein)